MAFSITAEPQGSLFMGELEVVDFKAPEFPLAEELMPAPPAEGRPGMGAGEGAPAGGNISETRPGSRPGSAPGGGASQGPELTSTGITWINSRPLTMEKLRGKVALIDFWEYTCINCIRTFPANKLWYARYHKYGFEIIGVHDPEFHIAYSVRNVREAVKRFQLPYPVVVDDKFEIWNRYHSDSWPNRFLIDEHGMVRYHRVGEGGDGAFEHAIQKLLIEAHPGLKFPSSYTIHPDQNAFAAVCGLQTAEMYVGQWGDRGILSNPEGYHEGKTIDYKLPASVEDGRVILSGRWRTNKNGMIYEGGKRGSKPGELEMRYHAREIYSVMNVSRGRPSRLYITQDGKDLTRQNKGADVQFDDKGHSFIYVREPRMYYLVQNPDFTAHEIVLTPSAPGITINSFTFGNNCQTDFDHL
ncbi:MAG: redoxin domain-containing protein [Acidobacteriota bacterium]|nr:redoxin domain-containing protein [Acidobacteriota bacterium]